MAKRLGRWLLRVQSKGIRRDFGLGSLKGVSLADDRDATLTTYAFPKIGDVPVDKIEGLPRKPKQERRHFAAMPYAEVPDFVEKLSERESVGRVALEEFILTAARSGEIRGALWSKLDLQAGLWTIPATRMKMGWYHMVPLSPEAAAVFESAKKKYKAGVGGLVFSRPRCESDMALLKILRDGELR